MHSSPPLPLGPIGLGCVTFGREIDEAASFAIMDHARERGIRHFDTAAVYSAGESERIVGKWLSSRRISRDAVVLATKIITPYEPEIITTSVRQCLERLGRIDLLYLHKWDETVATASVLGALGSLVSSGLVGALGVSNFKHDQLSRALALQTTLGLPRFRALQNNHNLAVREVDEPMRRLCSDYGVAIVTFSPLGAGFLTGKHRDGVSKGSRFDIIPGHQRIYFNDLAYSRLARLEAVSRRTGIPQTHLALAWALHQPGGGTVLVGGRTPAHIDQAFAALELNDPALFAELERDPPAG